MFQSVGDRPGERCLVLSGVVPGNWARKCLNTGAVKAQLEATYRSVAGFDQYENPQYGQDSVNKSCTIGFEA